MQNDTGRFERNALGVSTVVVTAGDGQEHHFTFEGSFVVAGVAEVPAHEGAMVSSALHSQGTSGGIVFAIALLLEILERQHSLPPALAVTQAMVDTMSLRRALEQPGASEQTINEDITNGVRVPTEPHKDDLLRRLRRLSSGGDVHEA